VSGSGRALKRQVRPFSTASSAMALLMGRDLRALKHGSDHLGRVSERGDFKVGLK
jgi:hypothetical protein